MKIYINELTIENIEAIAKIIGLTDEMIFRGMNDCDYIHKLIEEKKEKVHEYLLSISK